MKFSFAATIYKVGINPCVDVPLNISSKMIPSKGYIPVKGKIKDHLFTQTLVPVKNDAYRLYVNGPMLKGANAKVGDRVMFKIEQNFTQQTADNIPIPKELRTQLNKNKLFSRFKALTPYRQKEILRYLNNLKTKEALLRNINKLTIQLKEITQ